MEMATLKFVRLRRAVSGLGVWVRWGGSVRFGPDKGDGRQWSVVGVGVEEDGRGRVELHVGADAPELCAEEVGLLDAEEDEQGDDAGELGEHAPVLGPFLPPLAVEEVVCANHGGVCGGLVGAVVVVLGRESAGARCGISADAAGRRIGDRRRGRGKEVEWMVLPVVMVRVGSSH